MSSKSSRNAFAVPRFVPAFLGVAAAGLAATSPASAGWWYGPAEANQSFAKITYDPVAGGALPAPIAEATGLAWALPASLVAAVQDPPAGAPFNACALTATHWTIPTGVNTASAGVSILQLPRLGQLDFLDLLPAAEMRLEFQVVVSAIDAGFWYDPVQNYMVLRYFVPAGSLAEFESVVTASNLTTGALLSTQTMTWAHDPAIHGAVGQVMLFDANPAPAWIPGGQQVVYNGTLIWTADHVGMPMPGTEGVTLEITPAPCLEKDPPGGTTNRCAAADEGEAAPAPPCPADLDGTRRIDAGDVAALFAAWGVCDGACDEDFDRSGFVDFEDLLAVLDSWGACP